MKVIGKKEYLSLLSFIFLIQPYLLTRSDLANNQNYPRISSWNISGLVIGAAFTMCYYLNNRTNRIIQEQREKLKKSIEESSKQNKKNFDEFMERLNDLEHRLTVLENERRLKEELQKPQNYLKL